jgi:histidyl-tRNA synthetase
VAGGRYELVAGQTGHRGTVKAIGMALDEYTLSAQRQNQPLVIPFRSSLSSTTSSPRPKSSGRSEPVSDTPNPAVHR